MRKYAFGLRAALMLVAALSLAVVGCNQSDPEDNNSGDEYWDGTEYDELNPGAPLSGGKEDNLGNVYDVPTGLPVLVNPEIIVSLGQLTVHVFDRETGYSEVFPAGVGVINSDNVSITPTGHFATGPDTADAWWYIARRTTPAHFGGWPFIRLTMQNSRGWNTYGLHGPITSELIRGYVSHGCVRMAGEDVARLFYLIRHHPDTPVSVQREPELDAAGNVVDLDTEVTLWAVGEDIAFGESVGAAPPRDDTGTDNDGCADDPHESPDPVAMTSGYYPGMILCRGDTDEFTIAVSAGETLTVTVGFTHSVADLDLSLMDAAETVVDRSITTSDEETVTVTAAEDTTYLLQVYAYGEAENTGYTLTIE